MRDRKDISRMAPAKVLLVDDQPLYRESLREIMGHWPEFQVVGEAGDGWSSVTACRKLRPDLVIMDSRMPMMDGIEAARRIVSEKDGIAVVMLSVAADESDVLRAFDCGVRGYVLKETPPSRLRMFFKEAVRGDIVMSSSLINWLVAGVMAKSAHISSNVSSDTDDLLDTEERDVMALVAQGLSNEEIGARLYISPGSVKKRLRSIMGKLNLENRVQVAVYAARRHMDWL